MLLLRRRLCAVGPALMLAGVGTAQAQSVALAGRMGDKALLVIDGRPRTVAPGQTVDGVKLLRWAGPASGGADGADLEYQGGTRRLYVGSTPAQIGVAPPSSAAREVVLTAGPGGHFTTVGSINGKSVSFMVDTGATLVAIGKADAERLGIDLTGARVGMTQTANGAVPVQLVVLNSVRVGDLELANVGAAVMPLPMPVVLLGNSFLSRTQMRRENDVMRLERR